jgi:hypothetical protein
MPPSPTPTRDPRWTTPSEPQPSSFAADYVNSIVVRLGKKRFTKPSSEKGEPVLLPKRFRERSTGDANVMPLGVAEDRVSPRGVV